MAFMNRLFADYIDQFIVIYLDDLMISSKNAEDYYKHMRIVFEVRRLNKLYCRLKKCVFEQHELHFLGHVVGSGGLKVDPRKIGIIENLLTWDSCAVSWDCPTTSDASLLGTQALLRLSLRSRLMQLSNLRLLLHGRLSI